MTDSEICDKSWLITGGCGFIGRTLIDALLRDRQKCRIRVLDNLSVGSRADLGTVCEFDEVSSPTRHSKLPVGAVELVAGDIRDAKTTAACCEGVQYVVHLAANTGIGPSVENPRLDLECNVIGTVNVLEGARHAQASRVIFASSGAPVGEVEPPIHEGLAPRPVSPYGASKLAGEGYCSAYYGTFGLDTVALRFGNVYGPRSGHKTSVVAQFIRQAMNMETLVVYGDGGQTRDFIYIDDLIRAVLLSAECDEVGGEVFQIATGQETTVQGMLDTLLSSLEKHGVRDVRVEYDSPLPGEVRRNYSDTTKARKTLGWNGEVALADGLDSTVAWFMKERSR